LAVKAAIGAFIAQRGIGEGLVISRLVQVAHDASADVSKVSDVEINGVGSDLSMNAFGRMVPGIVKVLS